jgi:hypothetical protein
MPNCPAWSQLLAAQICLQNWPAELGGGPDALCLLVDLVSQCVFLPFSQPGPVDEDLLQTVQRSVLPLVPCIPQATNTPFAKVLSHVVGCTVEVVTTIVALQMHTQSVAGPRAAGWKAGRRTSADGGVQQRYPRCV